MAQAAQAGISDCDIGRAALPSAGEGLSVGADPLHLRDRWPACHAGEMVEPDGTDQFRTRLAALTGQRCAIYRGRVSRTPKMWSHWKETIRFRAKTT